jgi:RHS repeat-associated protein
MPTDRKFTGQRLDQTGLYYYGARYYDANIGRFISPDSIVPDPSNPQSLNRYSYCLNNPLRFIDPSGHSPIDEIYRRIYEGGGGDGNGNGGGSGTNGSDWSSESFIKGLLSYDYLNWPISNKSTGEILDEFQTVLDSCGLVPGVGEPFDAINALMSLGRGDLVAAAFSLGAIIPVAGSVSTVFKWGYRAGEVPEQLIRGRNFEKTVLSELGLTKNTTKIGNHIPDNITNGTITEIKDVKYLYQSTQLKGFLNSKLDLVVSPQTKISRP